MNTKQIIKVHKDSLSWQPWDAWSQFFLLNNVQMVFEDVADTLAIDYERLHDFEIDELNAYLNKFKKVLVFDLLDTPDYFLEDNEGNVPRNLDRIKQCEHDNIIFITESYGTSTGVEQIDNITFLYHRFVLNRSKFYYTNRFAAYKKVQPGYGVWYHTDDDKFTIPDIPPEIGYTLYGESTSQMPVREQVWLFAGRETRHYRTQIANTLTAHQHCGYLFYKDQRPIEENHTYTQ